MSKAPQGKMSIGTIVLLVIIGSIAFSISAHMTKDADSFLSTFDPTLNFANDSMNWITGRQQQAINPEQPPIPNTPSNIKPTEDPEDEQADVVIPEDVTGVTIEHYDKKINFSTIFLSLRKSCVEREMDLMQFSHYLTKKYMELYGYELGKTDMECIFLYDFINGNYNKDLMEGRKFVVIGTIALHAMQFVEQEYFDAAHTEPVSVAGHFNPNTHPYTILVKEYISDQTAWVLSHELSHMILYMKQNPLWIDGVHNYEQWRGCSNWTECVKGSMIVEYPYEPYKQQYYMMDVRSLIRNGN